MKLFEKELHARIESIYSETRLAFASDSTSLVCPVSQDGRVGFAILYTPPRYRPDLLIIGQNPGNFGPHNNIWDDGPNRMMMSGQVPTINSYLAHDHNFARELRRCFDGPNAVLLETCVGMNLWFFQARGTPKPSEALGAFCKARAQQIIHLIAPRTILCLSSLAFSALKTGSVSKFGDADPKCKLSHFGAIPMIYVQHPTGGRTRHVFRRLIPYAMKMINAILTSNADCDPISQPLPASEIPFTRPPDASRIHAQQSRRTYRIHPTRASIPF